MSNFSVMMLITGICICIFAYYLGMIFIDIYRSYRKNKKKNRKKK